MIFSGPYFKRILVLIGLALMYVGVQWMVDHAKKTPPMGIVESMTMKMKVQTSAGAMPVEIQSVTRQFFSDTVTYTGQAKAYNDIPIFPRITGQLVSMPVYPGDRVKQGQLLARLDSAEQSSNHRHAHFSQQRSQNAIHAAKANRAYWTSEIKRAESLLHEEVITQEEYDREKSQYESAVSQHQQAVAQHQATSAGTQTESIKLGYTRMMAPMDGVITQRSLDLGVLVTPGTEILRMAQLSPIRVQAHVAESDVGRITVGRPVWVWKGLHQQGTPIKATVSAIFPHKDLSTRTAVVEALLPNKEHRFVPGDFVTLSIETGQNKRALSVPHSALIQKDRETAVWTVKDDTARLQYVTTGGTHAGRTVVVSGLKGGEQVITRGHRDLQEGHRVIAAEFGPDGLKQLPSISHKSRMASGNHYRVQKPLRHWLLKAQLENPPVTLGKNTVTIQLIPRDGTLPDRLTLKATTTMPAMPAMKVPGATIKSLGKGLYKVNTQLPMPGLWQVDLIIRQGQKTPETVSIEVEVTD